MAKVKKVYAIKHGYDNLKNCEVKNIIVDNWNECSRLIKGVKGAQYKSFEILQEAKDYLSNDKRLLKKGLDNYPMDILHIYVDGSYNSSNEKFSYGLVAVKDDVIEYMESGASNDTSQKQIRQIAGELKATIQAVEYAKSKGEKKIVIFHDYEGIYHHALGTWERKDVSSKKYYETINKYINEDKIEIIFVKVDSHTGDIYNEITDSIAKKAIGVPLTDAVNKYIKENEIVVNGIEEEIKLKGIVNEKYYSNVKNIKESSKENKVEIENLIDVLDKNELKVRKNEIKENYFNLGEDKLKSKLNRLKKQELIDLLIEFVKLDNE
ncbi:ribonuclease H1 domain-containing protein [Clostridium senegalense]|uniref:ribonuclease H1 domain-containing protein n=1 Tax=Clostridium senegalense TaxID=1465809 RepID=UPI001C113C95|nr:ribonuclease H family protein [Clostridium senegalense]MBU5226130.1 ribonuclease H family protein [Clostridium senegalense]